MVKWNSQTYRKFFTCSSIFSKRKVEVKAVVYARAWVEEPQFTSKSKLLKMKSFDNKNVDIE
jgi:hypothetical protein